MLSKFQDASRLSSSENGLPQYSKNSPVSCLSPEASRITKLAFQAKAISAILKAAAHEGRFLILALLADGEKSVSELETITGLSQSVVSQQLARLRFGRLVEPRRSGRAIYYSATGPEVAIMVRILRELPPAASASSDHRPGHAGLQQEQL